MHKWPKEDRCKYFPVYSILSCYYSADFCESNLQLLFTILEKSPFPTIRANTIIALGDLTVRFPNLIEPWTQHMYARYRDVGGGFKSFKMGELGHGDPGVKPQEGAEF